MIGEALKIEIATDRLPSALPLDIHHALGYHQAQ
jgi:hypothetical protein